MTSAAGTAITYAPLGLIASYGDMNFTTDPLGMGNVLSDSKSGARYVYGNGLEARILNGKFSYYVTDCRGSVVAIVDQDGNITHKYQYDEFGKVTQKEEADYNPFQYVGKYGVMCLNDHLYYMRARHYDPTIGRFLSEDPIWSTNLYPYADNNPIMGIDPKGEEASPLGVILLPDESLESFRDRQLTLANWLYRNHVEGKDDYDWQWFRNEARKILQEYDAAKEPKMVKIEKYTPTSHRVDLKRAQQRGISTSPITNNASGTNIATSNTSTIMRNVPVNNNGDRVFPYDVKEEDIINLGIELTKIRP